jgi:ubiquinone/menaquinone biosynthesis C-methylase UbiE
MSYGWIDAKSISFNSLLFMDTWIVRYISHMRDEEFNQKLSVALAANPVVLWYFENKCSDRREYYETLVQGAPASPSPELARECEIYVLDALDTFLVYLYPAVMDELPYIKTWEAKRLLSITDFSSKTVLDIGSGTGRLAIAAAPLAKLVYACEPVDRLREYLRVKLDRLRIGNVFVVDGTLERLPFPDESFDIVVSGHVFGDDPEQELRLMSRVTKVGGCIIDCPGEETENQPGGPNPEMIELGFEFAHYLSVLGGDVYQYWKWKTNENIVREPG